MADYEPGSYGLVLLGMSLKPFGQREVARAIVLLADRQCPHRRPRLSAGPRALDGHCAGDQRAPKPCVRSSASILRLEDDKIGGLPFAQAAVHRAGASPPAIPNLIAQVSPHGQKPLPVHLAQYPPAADYGSCFIVLLSMPTYFMSFDLPEADRQRPDPGRRFRNARRNSRPS